MISSSLPLEATHFFKSYPCLYVCCCNKSKHFATVKADAGLALGPRFALLVASSLPVHSFVIHYQIVTLNYLHVFFIWPPENTTSHHHHLQASSKQAVILTWSFKVSIKNSVQPI